MNQDRERGSARIGTLQILRKLYYIGFSCLFAVLGFFVLFPVPRPFGTLDTGSRILTLDFTPTNQIVVGTELNVQVWNSLTYQRQRTLDGAVGPAAYSAARAYVAAVHPSDAKDKRQTVGLWDTTTGEWIAQFAAHTGTVDALAFNADGSLLASASDDGTVRVWSMDDMRHVQTLSWPEASAHVLAWSPDGRLLATSDGASIIELWRTDDWRVERSIQADVESVHSLAFSPDSQTLAAGGRWAFIKVWNVGDGRSAGEFQGHSDDVNGVIYSADGRYIVSASGSTDGPKGGTDSAVHLWSVRYRESVQIYRGSLDMIHRRRRIMTAVAINPDGSIVAGGDAQGTVRLWHAP